MTLLPPFLRSWLRDVGGRAWLVLAAVVAIVGFIELLTPLHKHLSWLALVVIALAGIVVLGVIAYKGANLLGLAVPAAAVAVQTNVRIGGPLAVALADAPIPLDELIRIEQALPYPTVCLADADAAATIPARRSRPEIEPTAEPSAVA